MRPAELKTDYFLELSDHEGIRVLGKRFEEIIDRIVDYLLQLNYD